MSEAHDADTGGDEIDLSDVPMDGAAVPERQEHEPEGDAQDQQQEPAQRPPLPPEELAKRYENTRTALAEERRARRDLERRLEALESGRVARQEPQQRQDAQPEEEIDPEVDPLGALKQMRAKVKAYEQAERLDQQTEAQRQQQEERFRRVERELSEHEADFKEEHPDYDDAAKHYAVTRAKELMGFGLTPQQIQPMLREEFATLAATAIGARKNPAAVVYELAKGRGYGQKTPDPKGEAKPGGKIEALQRGQQASSALSRTAGRATAGLDVATIANIDIHTKKGAEAFDKAFEALERRAKAAERGR